MDNPLQSALQKMGSNFLVAAFVPSMAFIVSIYIVFQPILPNILKYESDLPLIEKGIILLLFTTILGFTLYTIGIYVYKAFEGYAFILGKQGALRRIFLKKHKARYQKALSRQQTVQKQLQTVDRKLENLIKNPTFGKWYNKRLTRLIKKRHNLAATKYKLTHYLDHNYPPEVSKVMPTRFGNRLRAAEMYSGRYGIDAVPLWGKLVSSLSPADGMMEKINEANNQCQFLLNGALLGVVFSFLCIVVGGFKAILWWINQSANSNDGNLALMYLVLTIASIIVSGFFYEASLFNVDQFGEMIRTTYDLHRFDLLEAMHMKLPDSLLEEKKIWLKISHFVTGNLDYKEDKYSLDGDTIDFDYVHPNKQSISNNA